MYNIGPPANPTSLQALAISFTSLTLSWTSPTQNPHCIHNYVVHVNQDIQSNIYNTTDNTTSLTVTGLSRGVEYAITVAGRDSAGRVSVDSPTIHYTLDGK